MFVTTMMTGRTLRWIREPRRVVKLRRIPPEVAESYPCQDLAACIIVTISLPELSLRRFFRELTKATGEVCPLTRCIDPGTVFVVLSSRRSTHLQSTIAAKSGSDFIHQARFAPGWNYGEAHLWRSVWNSTGKTRRQRLSQN